MTQIGEANCVKPSVLVDADQVGRVVLTRPGQRVLAVAIALTYVESPAAREYY